MAEVRYNNQSGKLATVGTDVTNSTFATVINFAVAPTFSTLTAGQTITLALDAGLSTFEIVYLTAYTAGATTGTVTRAAEDSAKWPAVAHPVATTTGTWNNAPTVSDFPAALPPNGAAGGDLTGTYPNPTLATSGVTGAGTPVGSTTTVPVITYDAKGRLTTVTSATIAGGGITALTNDVSASGTGSVTSTVNAVQGVALTAAQATLVSQLNGATSRTASATVVAGEVSVTSGATNITLQLPAYTAPQGTTNTIVHNGSGTLTVGIGTGTTIAFGAYSGGFNLATGMTISLMLIGTVWTGVDSGYSNLVYSALPITKGGTSSTTASSALTSLGAQAGPLTGDVTTSGAAATLAASGVSAGSAGSTTTTPVITVDAKGRVTSLGSATIAGGGITALTNDVSASGTGSVTSTVNAVQGVALTAAQATLVSQLNNAINRTSGGAVNAGEITVFTGSAAILAVPGSTTQNSTVNTILNVSSNTVGVIAGSGTTLNLNGVAGSFTLPINSSCQLTYVSSTSTWYVTLSTFPLTGDVTTVGAAATLVGTANVNTVVGALATVAAKAPLASPTFSGVATAPVFSASGITGATASSRYIGAWTGPGSPLSGTFSVGDWGVDEGSPTVWVCTTAGTIGAGCVFQNIAAVTTLTKALQLALTETTNYEPQNQLQGNTAVSLVQNQTNTHLPPVAAVAAGGAGVQGMFTNGTTWTVKFASSILGTLGNVGDTFQCYSEGFVPTGWNTGNAIAPVIATVTSSTTVTIPVTLANPGTVTTWGTVHNLGIQYTTFVTPTGISIPRAIVEAEGINTFAQSADGTLGVGPVFQNAMAYKNAASPYSGTFACVLSSNLYKVIGDVRASIPARAKLVGPGVPANAAISSVYYDGSNTVVGAYIQNTFTPANFTGSTGNQTLKVIPDIYSAEGFVNFPSIIADGGPVSYPLVGTTFAKPGQNQGWSNGYWCGSVFGVINGGTLSNVNIADYGAEAFLGVGTSALLRYGYYFDDTQTLQSSGTGGTLATQLGLAVGHLNPDLTWDTLYGATTNVGILNASTTFEPSQPPTTTVASLSGFDPTTIATVAVTATTTGTNTNITITAAGTWLTGQKVWLSGFSNGITAQQYTIGTGGLGSFVVPVTGTVTATGTGNVNGLIPVASTTGFPATGSLKIGCGGTNSTQLTIIAYTGIIGSFFIGCTFTSGAGGASISAGVSVLGAVNAQTLVTGFTLPVPLGAKMALTSTSAVSSATTQVITGTPAYDGQMLRLVNVGSNIITFNSGGTTGLSLSTAAYLLQPKGSLNLQWDAILGLWIQANGTGGVTTVARPVARVTTINPPGSTATYNTDTLDVLNLTGLNGACNLATNQTGTPAIGDQLVIHVTDNGTARTLSYGSKFESGPAVLPTTTQISVMLTMQFIWNDLTSKWRCVGSSAGATSTAAAATVTTPTFTSGTATQLANTSQDAMIYLDITLAGTLTVAIGPTSTPANTLYSSVAVSTATAFPSIRLPAGWYIKVTAVTATYTANVITC